MDIFVLLKYLLFMLWISFVTKKNLLNNTIIILILPFKNYVP